mgnify:CR=1 FL=1
MDMNTHKREQKHGQYLDIKHLDFFWVFICDKRRRLIRNSASGCGRIVFLYL